MKPKQTLIAASLAGGALLALSTFGPSLAQHPSACAGAACRRC